MIKFTLEGKVKRIYDETRGQYTSTYVVAEESNGGKYANILRFKLKAGYTPPCGEGAQVKITAYLDGREWANPQGELLYFTDLRVDTIEVVEAGAPAPAPAPAVVSNWASLLALGTSLGKDQTAVIAACAKTHPGKASSAYTAADWQAVAAALTAEKAPAPAAPEFDDDSVPF